MESSVRLIKITKEKTWLICGALRDLDVSRLRLLGFVVPVHGNSALWKGNECLKMGRRALQKRINNAEIEDSRGSSDERRTICELSLKYFIGHHMIM